MGTHPIFESDFDCLTECKTDEKMSWLQNLAKKGENFLDQLDQQAGAAIEQAEVKIKGQNETDRDGEGYSPSKRISPMATMDRRLNTGGMSRSMSDRHLANHSPIQSVDRTLDRASPLFRSISQSSRLSSRDKRADFDPDQLSTTWSEPAHSDVPSQANSESEFEVVSGPGSVVGNDSKMPMNESINLSLENRLLRQELNNLNLEITRLIDAQRKSDRELELQNQELLRRRRSEPETSVEDLEKERERHMRDIDIKESQFEWEKTSLSEALSKAQISLQREKTKTAELTTQCRTLKVTFDHLKHDADDYKVKAQRILQSKEKIIESLKVGNTATNDDSPDAPQLPVGHQLISSVNLEELKHELEMAREESRSAKMQRENLRSELARSETQGASDYEVVEARNFELDQQNQDMNKERGELEADLMNVRQELRQLQEDFGSARQGLRERLANKDQEIAKIRGELMTRQSDTELEKRLRSLADTVIKKQTTIEALSSDKSSLLLEIERYKRNPHHIHAVPSGGGLRNRRQADFDYESSMDQSSLIADSRDDAVGKIKRAVGAIDKLSIRLGVLLRRYPTIRLLVIVYMIMLHVWTSVVLVTYEPEVHGVDGGGAGAIDTPIHPDGVDHMQPFEEEFLN